MPIANGNEKDNTSMKVLTTRIIELEKLQKDRMQATKTTSIQQWNRTLWNQHKNPKSNSILVIMFCGFQRKINQT